MNDFIQFLLDNWKLLLIIIFGVVEFILLLVFKKEPVFNLEDKIISDIYDVLPGLINDAEKEYPGKGKGDYKLRYVLKKLISLHPELFSLDGNYLGMFKHYIERILSTPQKKEEN